MQLKYLVRCTTLDILLHHEPSAVTNIHWLKEILKMNTSTTILADFYNSEYLLLKYQPVI